jgi:hypothetical protein
LDAYSGYHQITLAIDDEEKMVFITPFGIFCYTMMAFILKNGGGELHIRRAYRSSWRLRLNKTSRRTLMMWW